MGPKIIKIDNVEYVRKDSVENVEHKGKIKIVILQREIGRASCRERV